MNTKNPPSEKLSKEYYEIEKIKAEIAEIKRPPYKKISFWHFISTTLIAIGTVILLFINGAFDFKTKALELKRENLEYDVRQFTNEKTNLHVEIDSNKIQLAKLIRSKNELQSDKERLEYAYQITNGSLFKKDRYLASVLSSLKALKEKYNDLENKSSTDPYLGHPSIQPLTLSEIINRATEIKPSPSFALLNSLNKQTESLNSNLFTKVPNNLNFNEILNEKGNILPAGFASPGQENKIDWSNYLNISTDSTSLIRESLRNN